MPKQPEQFNKGEIIIYQPKSGGPRLEVELKEESVWLTQKQMSFLFAKDVRTINEHINNLFSEGELAKNSVIRKFRITAADGKEYDTNFYNLDVIISVGYRVKSKQGTEFRIWATRVLKDHLIKGYTLNQKRLKETNLMDLEQAVSLVKKALETKKLKGAEARGLLEVITKYAQAWLLLQKFDEEKLVLPAKQAKPKYKLEYNEATTAILDLKNNLLANDQATDLFGKERGEALVGIIGNLYQSFGGVNKF